MTDTSQDVSSRLRRRLRATLSEALGTTRKVAVVGAPAYVNPGDSAIWLGTMRLLAELDVEVRYACSTADLNLSRLRADLPDGLIILQGGGNLGGRYPEDERPRRAVLDEAREYPVLVMPQSWYGGTDATLSRFAKVLPERADVTLLARDDATARILGTLPARTRLSPDAAWGLDGVPGPRAVAPIPVLWLVRRDEERVDRGPVPLGPRERMASWMSLPRHGAAPPMPLQLPPSWCAAAHDLSRIAAERLWRGWTLLADASVVVTDTLHGHIMATLSGVPNIALDNSYGKVSATFRTWTSAAPDAHWADSWDSARDLAYDVLRRRPLREGGNA